MRVLDAAGEGTPGGDPAASPAPADPAPDPAPADTGAAPDLSFIGDDFRGDDGAPDLGRFTEHYQDLLAAEAQRNESASLIPDEYEWTIPDGLDLPEGYEASIDTTAEDLQPLFGDLGELMKSLGAPADAAGKIMGLLARYEGTMASRQVAAMKEQMDKLGANDAQREARISRVARAAEARMPAAQVDALMKTLSASPSYEAFRAVESLLNVGGPRPSTPTPTSGGDLEAMPPAERLREINRREQEKI